MATFLEHPCICALAAIFFMALPRAACAQSITVLANGNFGTVTAQPTASGPNNMEMGTNGTISYPANATGPATGTVMSFQATGYTVGDQLTVTCQAGGTNRWTNSTAGNGDASLNATTFRIVRQNTLGPGNGTVCNGLGGTNNIVYNYAGVAAQDTFYIDSLMNVTHPKFVGTYTLSADGSGSLGVRIVRTAPANTQNAVIDMSGVFQSMIAIGGTQNMDFGRVCYAAGALGAGDHVDLGTNSTAVFNGKFTSCPGSALKAGYVLMSNVQDGVTTEVDCDPTVTLTDGAGHSIQVTGIKARRENGIGSYAAVGTVCNGAGGAVTATRAYTAGTNDQWYFGGILDGSTAVNLTEGNYSTANAGGTNLTVTITTQ